MYRNPKPWLRAVQAWHPSIAVLESGEWVCGFDLGEAAESLDYRTYVSRSSDEGKSWSEPVRLLADLPEQRSTHTLRISGLRDGTLVACGARFFRDNPEEGLTNRANLGFVPLDLLLLRSRDGGRSWSEPQVIRPPLAGPAFEVCHAVTELSDGRWLWPTQTWPGWEGDLPNGMKAVAFVSRDRGKTWNEFLDIFERWVRESVILRCRWWSCLRGSC
ncbi:MAG: sialidase family protein [Planctomycetales bacterium]